MIINQLRSDQFLRNAKKVPCYYVVWINLSQKVTKLDTLSWSTQHGELTNLTVCVCKLNVLR